MWWDSFDSCRKLRQLKILQNLFVNFWYNESSFSEHMVSKSHDVKLLEYISSSLSKGHRSSFIGHPGNLTGRSWCNVNILGPSEQLKTKRSLFSLIIVIFYQWFHLLVTNKSYVRCKYVDFWSFPCSFFILFIGMMI